MKDRELLLHFMRSLKAKGLLHKDIHGSVVDSFLHSELPRITESDEPEEEYLEEDPDFYTCMSCGSNQETGGLCNKCQGPTTESFY